VFAARTPVVSAIGHETDTPLLDLVADLAASTPTDAAKRIVPDLVEERAALAQLRARARGCVRTQLQREAELMAGLPERMRRSVHARLASERGEADRLRDRTRRRFGGLLDAAHADLEHVRARVGALSPQSTLDRGYAVVRHRDGTVIRDAADARGTIRVRVARGEFDADVMQLGSPS
jgi:exodeoxyribonuclease VII large subunit